MQYRFEGSRIRDLFADRLYRSGSKAEGTDEILWEIPWESSRTFHGSSAFIREEFQLP